MKKEKLAKRLSLAGEYYRQGDWEAAGDSYRSIIGDEPGCGEAWFWMGVLSLNIDDPESATIFLEQAHAVGLNDPACLANLGEAYRRSGNVVAAEEILRQVCDQDEKAFGASFNLASLYAEAGRFDDALERLERMLAWHSANPRLQVLRGEVLKKKGHFDAALAAFGEALLVAPKDLPALLGQGDSLRLMGDYREAMAAYEKALAIDARNLDALNGLACVAVALADTVGAELFYRQALAIDPDCWESLLGFGMELTSQRRFKDAIEVLEKAVASHGDKPDAWMRLGEAYYYQEDHDAARRSYEAALAIDPAHVASLVGLGNVNLHCGNPREAANFYERAAELSPDDYHIRSNIGQAYVGVGDLQKAQASAERSVEQLGEHSDDPYVRFNASVIDLKLGNLERGWRNYDGRESLVGMRDHFPHPYWQGESLAARRILVWQDQGIGDQIMFASILQDAINQAAEVVIECDPKLLSLMRRSFPDAVVVPRMKDSHRLTRGVFDFQCATGSLARWLRPDIASFAKSPKAVLQLDPLRTRFWQARLAALSDQPKVGICWRSGMGGGLRKFSYAALDEWAEVFACQGITLVNLQYGDCTEDLETIRQRFGAEVVDFPFLNMYDDLDETCAMISQLDYVMTAPTAVSRQSGGVGCPTSLIAPFGDWTALGTDHDPWMPSIRQHIAQIGELWRDAIGRAVVDMKHTLALK